MWTVRSESGRLRAVLVQESIEQFWEGKFPFVGIESSTHYLARCPHAGIDRGRRQWEQLPRFLREEGVRVFEVTEILGKALEGATVEERRRMVEEVWEGMPASPGAEELTVEHLLLGYPPRPYYDGAMGLWTGWCFRTSRGLGGPTHGTRRSRHQWAQSSAA